MEDLKLSVKLEAFEGPLELLLHLIRKNEVNIYDIPIADITKEYIQAIAVMREMNLDIAGEFLVMAATLIYIKSRMLLPVYKDEDEDNSDIFKEDPREELVRLLLEYQKYQDAGKTLGQREILGRDTFKHSRQIVSKEDRPLKNMEIFQLITAYQSIINRYQDQFSIHDVDMPGKSLQDKIIELIDRYPEGFLNITLDELLLAPITRNEVVITFLCMLELAKLGYLKIIQNNNVGDILITTVRPLSFIDTNLISRDDLFKEAR
ncbi:MAG: segregation/condensation protein A [Proteobacteria bacterium]|nr:segregation/condensation protein A [Pseudomonadota bacterium]